MKRKALSLLLAALLALSLVPASAFAAGEFSDVAASAWYYGDVMKAKELGLINGYNDGSFKPGNNIRFSEVVKLAACMNEKYATGNITLPDSEGSPWYKVYVDYAMDKGIISKEYPWSDQASRADVAEIFVNGLPSSALKDKNSVADGYIPDVDMSHPQAAQIYKLYRAGILDGKGADHSFKPDDMIKRSEISAMLTRMMDDTARVEVTLGPVAQVTVSKQPEDVTIEYGTAATLSVEAAGGNPPYTYQWYRDGAKVSGATENTLTTGEAGTYYCRITDADMGSAVESAEAVIKVISDFIISKQPQDAALEEGESSSLSVIAVGGKTPYSYQWYKDGSAVKGANASSYSAGETGVYRCVVKDNTGKAITSEPATVTVKGALTLTRDLEETAILTLDNNTDYELIVNAEGGTEPYTYYWYRNGELLPDRREWYFYPAKQDGTYFCVITDAEGKSVASSKCSLSVLQKLSMVRQPVGGVIGPGESIELSVAVTGGNGEYIYQWFIDDQRIEDESGWHQTYTATVPGIYRCRVVYTFTDKDGKLYAPGIVNSMEAIVKEAYGELQIVEQPKDVVAPEGDYVTAMNRLLTVMANSQYTPLSYQWQFKDSGKWVNIEDATDSSLVPEVNGSYRVQVTDNVGQSKLSEVAVVSIKTWPLEFVVQPSDIPLHDWNHFLGYRYERFPIDVAVKGGSGKYSYYVEVRDSEGDEFEKVIWDYEEPATWSKYDVTASNYPGFDLGKDGTDYINMSKSGKWAYTYRTGFTVIDPSVQFRVVVEEELPWDSEVLPQRIVSRICSVRDTSNAKRGATELVDVQLKYDAVTDTLITYIYGGYDPYLVRWRWRYYDPHGGLGYGWYSFDEYELDANEDVTVELTDFGAIVRYPDYQKHGPTADRYMIDMHVKVWDDNGSSIERSITL